MFGVKQKSHNFASHLGNSEPKCDIDTRAFAVLRFSLQH